jgi:hypothetical protein
MTIIATLLDELLDAIEGAGKGAAILTAPRALLVQSDMRRFANPFIASTLDAPVRTHDFSTLAQFTSALARYQRITELTVLSHGHPGGFLLSEAGGGLTDVPLGAIATWYKAHPSTGRPDIDSIELLGCNIGLRPADLVPFGRLFRAKRVSAWNHFYVPQVTTVDVPENASAQTVRARLQPYTNYLGPKIDADTLVRQPGRHDLLVEWFRVEPDGTPLPPTGSGAGNQRKPFKGRWDNLQRKDIRVTSQAELDTLTDELATFGFADPVKPLYHITVDIQELDATAPTPP